MVKTSNFFQKPGTFSSKTCYIINWLEFTPFDRGHVKVAEGFEFMLNSFSNLIIYIKCMRSLSCIFATLFGAKDELDLYGIGLVLQSKLYHPTRSPISEVELCILI